MTTALKMFQVGTMEVKTPGGMTPIKPTPSDRTLQDALQDGILCRVLAEEAFTGDEAGLAAIITEDNMNAAVDMATNEMEVLTYIGVLIHKARGGLAPVADASDPGRVKPEPIIKAAMAHFGGKAFKQGDLKALYSFALRCPKRLLDVLAALHFAVIPCTMLRMPPKHFATIAGLSAGHGHCKAARW